MFHCARLDACSEEDIVPELLLNVCGRKSSNCATRSCKCSSNGIPCLKLYSCRHEFCKNTDPKEILEDDSSDGEDDINEEEGENDENLFTHLCELCFVGFSWCFLFVYILRRTHNNSYLCSGKWNLSNHLFWLVLMFIDNTCCWKTLSDCCSPRWFLLDHFVPL